MSAEILVVDDDEGMRLAVERLLVAGGYSVAAFASAESLLASRTLRAARCLIVDVRLPGLSGTDLCRRLASEGVGAPVILMTAHDDARTREDVRTCGAIGCLQKPFAGRRLLDAVARALGAP